MLRSMTAYGRSSLKLDTLQLTVEVQSVNRKYLEINVTLPSELAHFEIDIKKWIAASLTRGAVTVRISAYFENTTPFIVRPNLPLARQLKTAWEQIADDLQLNDNGFNLSLISDVKDILIIEENRENEETYRKHLKQAVDLALNGFMHMKAAEGAHLQADIANRIGKIREWVKAIELKTPFASQKYREKLLARLEELLPGKIENEERILREIALYAEKIDIAEEITRLNCHLIKFEELMHSGGIAVGKTLEFILQELNREINTIGSKSSDLDIAHYVIDIKSELERIREQIQNVE